MASSSLFSLLLRRRCNHRILTLRSLSTTSEPPKPSSLSARLSFVFDKIDEIEKERSEKDEALQRIRSWRQSKNLKSADNSSGNNPVENGDKLGFGLGTSEENEKKLPLGLSDENNGELTKNEVKNGEKLGLGLKKEIELTHPWPEWIEFMQRLVEQNYFDHKRKDEDKMVENLGNFDLKSSFDELGFDFTRDWKTVQTAILNFGRDRFDIMRSFSRQDIQTLVGYGCPSADKKVVFSSKLLRKHAHLDEGDVCSTCSLRNTCERAYLVTNKEDEARTLDVMRVLLTYGFDHINGSVENKSLLKQKSVKSVVRKLLHEVVRLSAVPIDPNLPPPVIKPRPPKVKQPPPPPKKRVGRDDIEMKKGDWLCPKCNFMNFAKNVVCLQCDAKRPKRQLLPGEWECPQCNFLNYRRNMTCFNCEHKRPPDEYIENQGQKSQHRPGTRVDQVTNRAEVSNAWNFDFDDDESDGADVAAFEYADPHAMNEDRLLDTQPETGKFSRGPHKGSMFQEKEHSRPSHRVGFDDFDDEDDDIDNYEVDDRHRSANHEDSNVNFSDVEANSESDGDDGLNSYTKSSANDVDFDSDDDLPVHPKWKSSHVADSGLRDRGSSRRMSLNSDDDDKLVFGSDDDDLDEDSSPRRGSWNDRGSNERGFKGDRGSHGSSRRMNLGSDDDDLDDEDFSPIRGRGNNSRGFRNLGDDSNRNSKPRGFRGRSDVNFLRGNDSDEDDIDEDCPSRRGRGNNRGSNSRGLRNDWNQNSKHKGFRSRGNDFDDDGIDDFSPKRGRGNGWGSNSRGFRNRSDDWNQDSKQRGFRGRGNEFDDEFGTSSRGSRGDRRGFEHGGHGFRGMDRGRRGGRGGRGSGGGGRRFGGSDNWSDVDNERPLRQRVNVR